MLILFLDDDPNRISAFKSNVPSAFVTTTAEDMIELLQKHKDERIDYVFLDHDLGGEVYVDSEREDTGMEVVRHMVNDHTYDVNTVVVHTMNPAGATNMISALKSKDYHVFQLPFGTMAFKNFLDAITND